MKHLTGLGAEDPTAPSKDTSPVKSSHLFLVFCKIKLKFKKKKSLPLPTQQ